MKYINRLFFGKMLDRELLKAVCLNQVDRAKKLLKKGADADTLDYTGDKPLSIFREGEWHRHWNCGATLLMLAAKNGMTDMVRLLLQNGAGVNERTLEKYYSIIPAGKTALMFAALNKYTQIVKLLVESGADLESRDETGSTALLNVCGVKGALDTLDLLIDKGADPNVVDSSGKTCLMQAAFADTETVRFLIEKGMDINVKDRQGETALMHAAPNPEVVKLLLQNGADPNARDDEGKTVLMKAVGENLDVSRILIDNGADINAKDGNDTTVLMHAVMEKTAMSELLTPAENIEIPEFLIEKGADINAKNSDGKTALSLAIEEAVSIGGKSHYALIELLLGNGAEPDENKVAENAKYRKLLDKIQKRIALRESSNITELVEYFFDTGDYEEVVAVGMQAVPFLERVAQEKEENAVQALAVLSKIDQERYIELSGENALRNLFEVNPYNPFTIEALLTEYEYELFGAVIGHIRENKKSNPVLVRWPGYVPEGFTDDDIRRLLPDVKLYRWTGAGGKEEVIKNLCEIVEGVNTNPDTIHVGWGSMCEWIFPRLGGLHPTVSIYFVTFERHLASILAEIGIGIKRHCEASSKLISAVSAYDRYIYYKSDDSAALADLIRNRKEDEAFEILRKFYDIHDFGELIPGVL